MATRKQRSRRAKTFRHDYTLVVDDEEGNEVEISAAEARAKKEGGSTSAKPGAKPAAKGSSRARTTSARDPQPPSWRRSLKKGLPWGLVAGVVVTFLLHGSPLLGLIYAVMFVPLTYWTDGMVYRRYQRKQTGGPAPRSGKPR